MVILPNRRKSFRASSTVEEEPGDPYFDNVVLLLHNDESSFLDSSSSPATVTVNSATFDSSVKKWGAGSQSARANNNMLTVTDDGRFGVTTEDWTVELWVAPDSSSGFINGRTIFLSQFLRIGASGTDDVRIQISFNGFATSTVIGTSAINMTLGTFYYVSVTRSGSNFEFRINGSLISSATIATAHDGSVRDVNIGGIYGNINYSRSWIDDVRVTVGVARDCTTVPTAAFPNFRANTSLLVHADDADGATSIVDSSFWNHTITANGNAKIRNKPNFPTSLYLDNGGSLQIPHSSEFDFGTGDFTIEFWYAFQTFQSNQTIYDKGYVGAGGIVIQSYSATSQFRTYLNGTMVVATWTNPTNNDLCHHVVTRKGETVLMYRDGQLVGSGTSSASLSNSDDLYIGKYGAANLYPVVGLVDDVRITKNVARYTSSHPPETETLPEDSGDPYWDDTVLLLKMEGEDGESTFTDSSSFGHVVSTSGTPQTSTDQAKFGNTSLSVNGSSYLSIADDPDLELGNGDFTIECWCYSTSSNSRTILSRWTSGSLSWFLGIGPSLGFYYNTGSAIYAIPLTTWPKLNEWFKIAVVRQGAWVAMFIDGEIVSKPYYMGTAIINNGTGPITIGDDANSNAGFYGYIDEVRITKAARYNFATYDIPATRHPVGVSDPEWSNTALLIQATGDEGDTEIVDSSSHSHTVTEDGSLRIIRNHKFDGAMQFDSVNGNFSIPDSPAFDVADEDFTLEFFFRPVHVLSVQVLCVQRNSNAEYSPFLIFLNGSVLYTYFSVTGSAWLSPISIGGFTANTEHHYALVRSGSSLKVYIDGVQTGVTITTSDPLYNASSPVYIGSDNGYGRFGGYMDEIRLVKGVAVYTEDFTPPESPFAKVEIETDPYFGDVVLLLHCDGDDESTTFIDSSSSSHTITAYGAEVDTADKKFGTGSALLNGGTDRLQITDSTDFDIGLSAEPWTFECWLNPANMSGQKVLFSRGGGTSGWNAVNGWMYAFFLFNGTLYFQYWNGSTFSSGSASSGMSAGTWYYVALVSDGASIKCYIDGSLKFTINAATIVKPSATNLTAVGGAANAQANSSVNGQMDDIRLTKGIARDVTAVPTSPFLNY